LALDIPARDERVPDAFCELGFIIQELVSDFGRSRADGSKLASSIVETRRDVLGPIVIISVLLGESKVMLYVFNKFIKL
jgi:hypothetical protein